MKRIFIAVVAMATILIGAWSCAEVKTNVEDGLARKSFDDWVARYAPNAYKTPYKEIYIEYIERGPEEGAYRPVIGNSWLDINYTGKTFSQNTWEDDPTNGTVFVTRNSLVSQLVGTFKYTTHFANDFVDYDSHSTKLCKGLLQAFEQMRVGDSVRIYVPVDKGYSVIIGEGDGYAVPNVTYLNKPIMFEVRLNDVIMDPFVWERDSVDRYAKKEWGTDCVKDTVGMFRHLEKPNPDGYEIGEDSTVHVYYEEYFMDGFLSSTNIDTVAAKWSVYDSETEGLYEPYTFVPSSGERADVHKVFYIVAPHMRQGEIVEVVTVSTWARGDLGDAEMRPVVLPYQPMRYRIHYMKSPASEGDDTVEP